MKDLDVGHVIAQKYVLVRLLGVGAMGQVWVARHVGLQQTFAVKLMVPPAADDDREDLATALKRFENEAQIAAALSRKSRHIARVSDYGIDVDESAAGGTSHTPTSVAYLVMELLEGEGLEKRIGDGRRLHPAEVSTVITQLAKGLAVAHAEGVTHRDLKPANVFLTRSEEGELLVKVLDFGIARMARHIVKKGTHAPTRLTMKGLVLGTPSYMSPEQAMAEPTDVRSDVWALATVAYEALAGVTPFHADSADDVILRICNFRPTPLRAVLDTATVDLAAVFERAFLPSIDERFQTATDFATALAAALPTPAAQLSLPPPPAHLPTESVAGTSLKVPLRPRTVAWGIAVVVVALVIAGVAVGARRHGDTMQLAHSSLAEVPPPPSVASVVTAALPVVPTQTEQVTARAVDMVHHGASHVPSAPPVASARASAQPDTTPPPSKSVDRSAIF